MGFSGIFNFLIALPLLCRGAGEAEGAEEEEEQRERGRQFHAAKVQTIFK